MENLDNAILVLGTVILLGVGIYLALQSKTKPASAVFAAMTVFLVLLVGTRYKHIKMPGFEADAWEQEQIEAAVLIKRLSGMSEALSRQIALIASRLGFFDSSLSNPQLASMLDQTQAMLEASDIPASKQDELLKPLIDRIEQNYFFAAQQLTDKAIMTKIQDMAGKVQHATSEDERNSLNVDIASLDQKHREFGEDAFKQFTNTKTIEPFISFVKSSNELEQRDALLNELTELDTDLKYFIANRKLRRNIDLNYDNQ
jgi:hypothetical protein